jgi:hypothetical protein
MAFTGQQLRRVSEYLPAKENAPAPARAFSIQQAQVQRATLV